RVLRHRYRRRWRGRLGVQRVLLGRLHRRRGRREGIRRVRAAGPRRVVGRAGLRRERIRVLRDLTVVRGVLVVRVLLVRVLAGSWAARLHGSPLTGRPAAYPLPASAAGTTR